MVLVHPPTGRAMIIPIYRWGSRCDAALEWSGSPTPGPPGPSARHARESLAGVSAFPSQTWCTRSSRYRSHSGQFYVHINQCPVNSMPKIRGLGSVSSRKLSWMFYRGVGWVTKMHCRTTRCAQCHYKLLEGNNANPEGLWLPLCWGSDPTGKKPELGIAGNALGLWFRKEWSARTSGRRTMCKTKKA